MFLHTLCYKYPSTTTVFSAFTSIGYCVFLEILLNELFPPPLENRLCEMRDWVLFSLPAQYRVATQKKNRMNECYIPSVFSSPEMLCFFLCAPPLFTSPWTFAQSTTLQKNTTFRPSLYSLCCCLFCLLFLRIQDLQPSECSPHLRLLVQYLSSLMDINFIFV